MQSKHRRKKCLCCKQSFTTDPRNHHHQRFCTKVRCQKASKILSQKRWSAKPANRDHWRGPSEVVRGAGVAKEISRLWEAAVIVTREGRVPSSMGLPLQDFIAAVRGHLSSWNNAFEFRAGRR